MFIVRPEVTPPSELFSLLDFLVSIPTQLVTRLPFLFANKEKTNRIGQIEDQHSKWRDNVKNEKDIQEEKISSEGSFLIFIFSSCPYETCPNVKDTMTDFLHVNNSWFIADSLFVHQPFLQLGIIVGFESRQNHVTETAGFPHVFF